MEDTPKNRLARSEGPNVFLYWIFILPFIFLVSTNYQAIIEYVYQQDAERMVSAHHLKHHIKNHQQRALEERKKIQILKEQRAREQFDSKIAREEAVRREKELEIQRMEKEEIELINRLQLTQQRQKKGGILILVWLNSCSTFSCENK